MLPAFRTECTVWAVCNYRAPDSLCLTEMTHLLQSSNTILGRQIFEGLERWLQIAFDGECACACLCVCVHIAVEGGHEGLTRLDAVMPTFFNFPFSW